MLGRCFSGGLPLSFGGSWFKNLHGPYYKLETFEKKTKTKQQGKTSKHFLMPTATFSWCWGASPRGSPVSLAPFPPGTQQQSPPFPQRRDQLCPITAWCNASSPSDVTARRSLVPAPLQSIGDGCRWSRNDVLPTKRITLRAEEMGQRHQGAFHSSFQCCHPASLQSESDWDSAGLLPVSGFSVGAISCLSARALWLNRHREN